MKSFMNRSNKAAKFLYTLLNHTKKRADHKTLSRHIIKLNQKKKPGDIIRQSASCLKEIAQYRLFAFAIKTTNQTYAQTYAWMDPDICKKKLEKMIRKDFNLSIQRQFDLALIHDSSNTPKTKFHIKDLISYEIHQSDFTAKIYMIPGKTMLPYHDEIAQLVLKSTSVALSRQIEIQDLSNAATIDSLTGCYNRREFENQLKKNIAEALRHKTDLSIFMFDLDYFKQVNDQYGHLAGDTVLKDISSLISENMRKGDILSRYGGEEFIAILPRTGKDKAIELAERLRIKIMAHTTRYHDKKIKVTGSFGVAQLTLKEVNMESFIRNADDMLYKAKLKGRNIVMPGLMKIISPQPNTFTTQAKVL